MEVFVFVFVIFYFLMNVGFAIFGSFFIPIFIIYSCTITCKYYNLKYKYNTLNQKYEYLTKNKKINQGIFNEDSNEEIIKCDPNEIDEEAIDLSKVDLIEEEEDSLKSDNEIVTIAPDESIFNDCEEEEAASNNYDVQRNLGVVFVILAAIIFATTTWNMIGPNLKVLSIFIVSVIFFTISNYFNEKRKLEKTSITFYNLGSLMIPVTILAIASFEILGDIFSIFNHSIYLVQTIMSITFAMCTYKGHLIYKSDTFMQVTSISNFVTVFMLMMFITSDFKFSLLGLLIYASGYITYRIEKYDNDFYNIHAVTNFTIILVLSSLMTNINSLPFFISTSLLILFMLYTVSDKLIGRNYSNDISNVFYPIFIVIASILESGFILYSIILIEAIICFLYLYKQNHAKEIPYVITLLIFIIFFRHYLTYGINYYSYVMYIITFFSNLLIVTKEKGNHKLPSNLLFIAFTFIIFNQNIYMNLVLYIILFITYFIQRSDKYCFVIATTIGNIIPMYMLYLLDYNCEMNQLSYNTLAIILGIVNYYLSSISVNKTIFKFFAAFLTYVGFIAIILFGLSGELSFMSVLLIGLLGLVFNYLSIKDKDEFISIIPNFIYTFIVLGFIYSQYSYINLLLLILLFIIYFIQNNEIYYILTILISNFIPVYILQLYDYNYDVYYLSYNILYMVLGLINYYLTTVFKDNKELFRILGVILTYINYTIVLFVMEMPVIYLVTIGVLTLLFNYVAAVDKKAVMAALPNIIYTNLILNYLSGVVDVNIFMNLLLLTSLVYMFIGRVCFEKIFVEGENNFNLDYMSLCSVIFMFRAFSVSTSANVFIVWFLVGLYFINLFNRGNKIVDYISLIGAGFSSYCMLSTQTIIPISDIFLTEYTQGSIIIILLAINYVIKNKYDETIESIIFITSIVSTFILMVNIFERNILINLVLLLSALVLVLLWSNAAENKKWQIFSLVSIVILLFLKTRLFWFSIPWWIYLLITGLTLIIAAANKENTTKK